MSIKGIDELRELPLYGAVRVNGKLYDEKLMMVSATKEQVNEIADKIEREIERDYIRLPSLDDGVLRPGDKVVSDYGDGASVSTIRALIFDFYENRWDFEFDEEDGDTRGCASISDFYECSHHYHAPTVEDVLRGVVTLCANTWKGGMSCFSHYTVDDMMESGNMHDFADKLREVLRDELS